MSEDGKRGLSPNVRRLFDLLIGSSGLEGYYEDGQWKVRRSQQPNVDANGNDTYLFGRGDGQDTVIDGDWTAAVNGAVNSCEWREAA